MITGIFGLIFVLPAIAAIILGHMSRSEIRKSNSQLKGEGMATAGLVMGYRAFAVIPLILIIAILQSKAMTHTSALKRAARR